MINKLAKLLVFVWLLSCSACMVVNADKVPGTNKEAPSLVEGSLADSSKKIPVTDDSFVCLKEMHSVRGFFVGNLLGNLDDTIAAAMSPEGATYPPGSVVQLIPAEVMIKHHKGWNVQTNDWEFFELNVSKDGAKIKVRGTTQVLNKFGGNCFECHQKAKPQWDLICEEDHGCDPLPIPDFVIRWTQRGDPRCD